jgi:hypothetical protein
MMVLVLILVSATAQIAGAVSNTWYLSSTSTPPDGDNKVMYKGSQDGGTDGVWIGLSQSVIWIANQPAQCNVGFAAGNWAGHLRKTNDNPNADGFNVAIGVWDGSSFTSYGNADGDFGDSKDKDFTISANTFDVIEGQYLAFNVTNSEIPHGLSHDGWHFRIVTDDGPSYVSSPEKAPDYPVPELSTIILVSAGLLILAGYVYMGKRSK